MTISSAAIPVNPHHSSQSRQPEGEISSQYFAVARHNDVGEIVGEHGIARLQRYPLFGLRRSRTPLGDTLAIIDNEEIFPVAFNARHGNALASLDAMICHDGGIWSVLGVTFCGAREEPFSGQNRQAGGVAPQAAAITLNGTE